MFPSGIVSRENNKTKEHQSHKGKPTNKQASKQASALFCLPFPTSIFRWITPQWHPGCPRHCRHVTSDCRFSPQKGIQKNMTGNTAENTAPIAPSTMGASASLPISSCLICNTEHSITLKRNSLLSVKHTRGEGCGVARVTQQAHMHTAMPPDITAPLLEKPLQPRQEKWRAEDQIRLM